MAAIGQWHSVSFLVDLFTPSSKIEELRESLIQFVTQHRRTSFTTNVAINFRDIIDCNALHLVIAVQQRKNFQEMTTALVNRSALIAFVKLEMDRLKIVYFPPVQRVELAHEIEFGSDDSRTDAHTSNVFSASPLPTLPIASEQIAATPLSTNVASSLLPTTAAIQTPSFAAVQPDQGIDQDINQVNLSFSPHHQQENGGVTLRPSTVHHRNSSNYSQLAHTLHMENSDSSEDDQDVDFDQSNKKDV